MNVKKTKKSRVILSGVSLLLVLSLLAGMTMAWFSDTEKVQANFTAGVLDINVKPGGSDSAKMDFENLRPLTLEQFGKELVPEGIQAQLDWKDENSPKVDVNSSTDGFAPIPVYFKPVTITNDGTLPAKVQLSMEALDPCGEPIKNLVDNGFNGVKVDETHPTRPCGYTDEKGNSNYILKDVLKVFVYKKVDGKWQRVENTNLNTAYNADLADPEKLAVDESAKDDYSRYTAPVLKAGDSAQFVIAGYLPRTVGNAYQGKHFHGNLVVNAYQMDDKDHGGTPDTPSGGGEPEPGKGRVTVTFYDLFNEKTVAQRDYDNLPDGEYIFSSIGFRSASIIEVPAPEGYEYCQDSQKETITVKDGKASGNVVFNVMEDLAPSKVMMVFYEGGAEGPIVGHRAISIKEGTPVGKSTISNKDYDPPAGYRYPYEQEVEIIIDEDGTVHLCRLPFIVVKDPFYKNVTVRFTTTSGEEVGTVQTSLPAGKTSIFSYDFDPPEGYHYTWEQETEVIVQEDGTPVSFPPFFVAKDTSAVSLAVNQMDTRRMMAAGKAAEAVATAQTTYIMVQYAETEPQFKVIKTFNRVQNLEDKQTVILTDQDSEIKGRVPTAPEGYTYELRAEQTQTVTYPDDFQSFLGDVPVAYMTFILNKVPVTPSTITKDVTVKWVTADGAAVSSPYTASVEFENGATSAALTPDTTQLNPMYELATVGDTKTIQLLNGEASPSEVTFVVKLKEDYDPEKHPERYQVRVDFRNTADNQILTSKSKTYTCPVMGVYSFTPADTEVVSGKVYSVAAPEGYEYDPVSQTPQIVTLPVTMGPATIIFTVKAVGGTDPENPDCPTPGLTHEIKTAEDLYNIRQHPHCKFKLANDIDLGTAYPDWTPIGELKSSYDPWNGTTYEPTENVFTGVLDGNGHSITGLNVGTLKSFNGLFSYSSGTIRNLKLTGTINAHSNSGILVGWNTGTIENCTVNGSITAGSQTDNIWEVGGIVGWNDTTGRISSCVSNANVSGNPAYMGYQAASHYYYGGVSGSNNGTITNCCSTGAVKGARAGGLLGYNSGTITNCYTTSKVYAQIDTYGNTDTWTHPTIGQLDGGTVGKTNIFFQKGNLYRNNQLYTGWDTDTYRGRGKTEAEMKTAATYTDAGWDASIWNITDGAYPTLK